jgi:hypothetical protein
MAASREAMDDLRHPVRPRGVLLEGRVPRRHQRAAAGADLPGAARDGARGADYQTQPLALPPLEAAVRRPGGHAGWPISTRTAGLRPGYKLKLNSYDLGVDIELNDALNRIRFEHPEVRTVVRHQRQGQGVLLGRQHLHAGRLQPRLEGELLQVHQRDAQRHRGSSRHSGLKFLAAVNGSPAPAAATSWRWPATRSSWSTTAPAP